MKILISRPDKIGDVILALQGVKQLKCYCPEVKVYMHVAEYTRSLVENVSYVDGVVGWDEDLKPYRFDAVVDLMAKFVNAWKYYSAGIPIRVGNSARWFCFFYNRTTYVRRSRALQNEAEYNWKLLSLLDSRLRNTRLKESLSLEDLKEIKYPELPGDFYCLFPGVTVSAEAWPFDSWCELAELLIEQTDKEILFLLGPAEAKVEPDIKERFKEEPRVHVMVLADLQKAAGVLHRCRAYVGPSTGITHLAGVVGSEGVALYPEVLSMHPDRWAPFRSSLQVRSPAAEVSAEEVARDLMRVGEPENRRRAKISAFIISKNEELNIGRCLDSLSFADEILLVDSGSSDKTIEIAREYPKVRIIERGWPGHREQKQFSLGECKYDWVINLDSDEELSSSLKGQVLRVLEDDFDGLPVADGYFLCRVVYYLNRWWDKGGWHPEYRMRFFKRELAQWGGLNPHEKAQVAGQTKKLRGFIYHYSFDSITEFISTQNRFSLQSAKAMNEQGIRSSIGKMIVRPVFRFFKFYVIKAGFREGRHGFIQAVLEAFYTFLKYAKLWEMQRKPERNIEVMTRIIPEEVGSERQSDACSDSGSQSQDSIASASPPPFG